MASKTERLNDTRIEREIWAGQVPMVFNLDPAEVLRMEQPLPLYLLLPRMSFLPLVTLNVQQHFLLATTRGDAREKEMWFEYASQPLKWNIPIGVLFDLLAVKDKLPMEIIVHFEGFPKERILACPNMKTVRSYFMNSFKEAGFIKYGDATKHFMGLPAADSDRFWQSMLECKQGEFTDVIHRCFEDRPFVRLPIRIFIKGLGDDSESCIQPLVPLTDANGNPHTLGSALATYAPGVALDINTLEPLPDCQIFIQGISPALNTPLEWLCTYLQHPDMFLYICLVVSTPPQSSQASPGPASPQQLPSSTASAARGGTPAHSPAAAAATPAAAAATPGPRSHSPDWSAKPLVSSPGGLAPSSPSESAASVPSTPAPEQSSNGPAAGDPSLL